MRAVARMQADEPKPRYKALALAKRTDGDMVDRQGA